jgi:predicted RNA-binding Zn-ribbon protein involved in translation (DUF1610 family)
LRKPKVLRAETRDYGELTCPKCGSHAILRLGTSNVVVWDYQNKTYTVVEHELSKNGMLSSREFKATFECGKCHHRWSIISGI